MPLSARGAREPSGVPLRGIRGRPAQPTKRDANPHRPRLDAIPTRLVHPVLRGKDSRTQQNASDRRRTNNRLERADAGSSLFAPRVATPNRQSLTVRTRLLVVGLRLLLGPREPGDVTPWLRRVETSSTTAPLTGTRWGVAPTVGQPFTGVYRVCKHV